MEVFYAFGSVLLILVVIFIIPIIFERRKRAEILAGLSLEQKEEILLLEKRFIKDGKKVNGIVENSIKRCLEIGIDPIDISKIVGISLYSIDLRAEKRR